MLNKYFFEPRQYEKIEIYNPMKAPSIKLNFKLTYKERITCYQNIIKYYKNSSARYFTKEQLMSYSKKLVELGITISKLKFDFILCPLRGAYKPISYLKVMGVVKTHTEKLPFTQGSSNLHDKLIISYLDSIINKYSDGSKLHIAILDTAIGGNSVNKLSDLLIKIKSKYPNEDWFVNFFVIHDNRANISNIDNIKSKSTSNLIFNIDRIQVENLLIEDWDSAIGIKVIYKENHIDIKPSLTEGRLILNDGQNILVIDSEDMSKYFDNLIGSHISEEIETMPGLNFSHNVNAWENYKFR